jgi:hypothetical protein
MHFFVKKAAELPIEFSSSNNSSIDWSDDSDESPNVTPKKGVSFASIKKKKMPPSKLNKKPATRKKSKKKGPSSAQKKKKKASIPKMPLTVDRAIAATTNDKDSPLKTQLLEHMSMH